MNSNFIQMFTRIFLALLLSLSVAQAVGPDEDYLRIYGIIEQADSLGASGKDDAARAKYVEAQQELLSFKLRNPVWNPKVVAFRLNYVATKAAPPVETQTVNSDRPSTATASEKSDLPQVKLLEAGAEPRTVLRLHPKVGDTQTSVLVMSQTMEMEAAGDRMPSAETPALRMVLATTVTSASPEGEIAYEMEIVEVGIADNSDAASGNIQKVKDALAGFKGTKAIATINDRGVLKSMKFKGASSANAQSREVMDQMKSAAEQFRLPEEAVGVGAKWEVRQKVKMQGITVNQTDECEVSSVNGNAVTLRTTSAQQAANQKMQVQNAAMPGVTMEVVKLAAKGNGTTTFDLGQVMPSLSTADNSVEVNMTMSVAGQKQAMTMKMAMKVKFEAK